MARKEDSPLVQSRTATSTQAPRSGLPAPPPGQREGSLEEVPAPAADRTPRGPSRWQGCRPSAEPGLRSCGDPALRRAEAPRQSKDDKEEDPPRHCLPVCQGRKDRGWKNG